MKNFCVCLAFCMVCAVSATASEKGNPRMDSCMWEAFSCLNDAERAELMKLQRDEPEKFRAEMEKRAEAVYREKLAHYEEMQKIVDRCIASTDEAEKAALKAQLREKLASGFDRRLALHRRQAEAMKRRAASIEKEIDRRAASRDAILDAHLDAVLSGKEKLRVPRRKLQRTEPVPER
ncbi:MAG: hypothetical protein MJ016_08110 [Victivallaceae bacterium]|nr:hypothetical protein [Victivallaceae bacterium]